MEMKMNDYQQLALRTANDKVEFNTRLAVAGLGLTGEAGEVADLIKKNLGHGHPLEKAKVKKELGDLLWYVAEAAWLAGYTLEDVAQTNIEKLKARYPEGFSEERSKNRVIGDE